jgi:hypothetical protein
MGLKAAGREAVFVAGGNFAGWIAGHGLRITPSAHRPYVVDLP